MRDPLYAQQPRSLIWRRRAVALGTFAAIVAAILAVTLDTLGVNLGGGGSPGISIEALRTHPVRVAPAGRLPRPVAQAAGAVGGGAGAMLLVGGLGPGGAPSNAIQRADGAGAGLVGQLRGGLAAAAAAEVGGTVYVIGGGTAPPAGGGIAVGGPGAPVSRAILEVPATGSGTPTAAAQLPAGVTEAAVAVVGGTAFVIGGYDGSREVDGVLAWKPGGAVHPTAHLPGRLRFAAAASSGGRVIVAGGTSAGVPTRDILRFDPATHRVTRIGQLPMPLSHAGAAALGGLVFVIGGRGPAPGSVTRAIYAIDPATGAVRFAGALPVGLTDAAVVAAGSRILVAGGTDQFGRVQAGILAISPR